MARVGVIVFPGSNCDHDAYHALKHVMNAEVKFLWHKETDVSGLDMIIVPGGFSYGDYLRSGAIARFSPIMQELISYAHKGGPVMGICNGFQILLEAGLIPGAMRHNEQLKFICKDVHIRVESTQSIYTSSLQKDQLLTIPVSHGEGNYYIDNDGLKELQDNDQVLFRYVNAHGETSPEANINGSIDHIAGITNKHKNVLGMMPHPERAMERLLGKEDGKHIFESILQALAIA
ncbi:phosphoribosylformylglycinamidine synthase subunit PurQ [Balneolaceae bacterium]|nr:phosphoribosylformylglycinamidine synthase subunit PurQ [Balneolaceae bacterium]